MKLFKKISALVMVLALSLSTLAGCSLVSKDLTRDLNQVVATVQVSSDAPAVNLYKKEMAYNYLMSSAYQSVQNGESTMEEQMETIFTNILNREILFQLAVKDLSADLSNVTNQNVTDAYSADRYLTEEEIEEIKYNVNKSINDSIENYVDTEEETDELKKDTVTEQTRTAPTGATNKVKTLDFADWKAYNTKIGTLKGQGVDAGFTINADGSISLNNETDALKKREAYNKLIKSFDENGLLVISGSSYDYEKNTIYDSYYYDYSTTAQKKQKVVDKWEKQKRLSIMSGYTYEDVCAYYDEYVYGAQVKNYNASVANYASALSNASKTSPVVYNPYSGYGYVYNLLLGVDDIQTSELSSLATNLSEQEKSEARRGILSKTTVKDLRSTWITSNYDSTFVPNEVGGTVGKVDFINDYSYYKGDDKLTFQGEVKWNNYVAIDDRADDYEAEASVRSVKSFGLDEFINYMDGWLYGSVQVDDNALSSTNTNYYKVVKSNVTVADWDQKIKDLLFAYSTDSGSLSSTYKGYLVKPNVDPDEQEQYVGEFQMASKKVLELGAAGDTSSYAIVATQYGYHIIFYSESIAANTNYDTLCKYLNKAASEYDTFEYDNVQYANFLTFFNEVTGKAIASLDAITDADWKVFYGYMLNNIDKFANSDLSDFYLFTLQQGRSTYFDSAYNDFKDGALYNLMYDQNAKPIETYVKIYKDRFSDYFNYEYLDKNATN